VIVGGLCCYWRGDARKVLDELKHFKPNCVGIVPRILNRVFASVNTEISQLTGLKKCLFDTS
jgi:long-subunit acyl-CoA synthetase (AMP-forming)